MKGINLLEFIAGPPLRDNMKLYRVAFIAGSEKTGAVHFEAWVWAPDAEQVEETCRVSVAPLQIASFESKTRYYNSKFILISKGSPSE